MSISSDERIILPKQFLIQNHIKTGNELNKSQLGIVKIKGDESSDSVESAIRKQQGNILGLSYNNEQINHKQLYQDLLMQQRKEKNDEIIVSLEQNSREIIDKNADNADATKVSKKCKKF